MLKCLLHGGQADSIFRIMASSGLVIPKWLIFSKWRLIGSKYIVHVVNISTCADRVNDRKTAKDDDYCHAGLGLII